MDQHISVSLLNKAHKLKDRQFRIGIQIIASIQTVFISPMFCIGRCIETNKHQWSPKFWHLRAVICRHSTVVAWCVLCVRLFVNYSPLFNKVRYVKYSKSRYWEHATYIFPNICSTPCIPYQYYGSWPFRAKLQWNRLALTRNLHIKIPCALLPQ